MVTQIDETALAGRRLILRDSLAFLSLVLVTLVLFGMTLLLFRSFSAHREDLAKRWSDRGAQAIQEHRPAEAVVALRTALAYAPDARRYQLLLAQALGEAGRINESYSYFMELWETQPGDGFINLELARLASRQGNTNAAIEFYRASIYGTWPGDGVLRRADVRLELAQYLIANGRYDPARVELLIAGGNVPASPAFDARLGELLEQAQDPADAWSYDTKARAGMPRDPALLERSGRLAYTLGDYEAARRLLSRAVLTRAEARLPPEPDLIALREQAERLQELTPAADLPLRERVRRMVEDRSIAKRRLDTCVAKFDGAGGQPPSVLLELASLWAASAGTASRAELGADAAVQDAAMRLVYRTELTTATVCQPAQGDDALLLLLAHSSAGTAAGSAPGNVPVQEGKTVR